MKQPFVILRMGSAVSDPNTFMITGYWKEQQNEKRTFRAFLGMKEVPVLIKIHAGAEVVQKYRSLWKSGTEVDQEYCLFLQLPKQLPRNMRLRVFVCEGNRRELLCQPDTKILLDMRECLEGCLDEVRFSEMQKDKTQSWAVIKGWAVAAQPFAISVEGADGKITKLQKRTHCRRDIVAQFPEFYRQDGINPEVFQNGFEADFPVNIGEVKKIILESQGRKKIYQCSFREDQNLSIRELKNSSSLAEFYRKYGMTRLLKRCLKLEKKALLPTPASETEYGDWRRKEAGVVYQQMEEKQIGSGSEPFFSIVVPLYQTKQEYLLELITSIQKQTCKDWELCLSDGGGSGSILKELLKELCQQEKRIKVVTHQESLGIAQNTNEALKIASGKYIVFADHDDLLEADALAACAAEIEKNSQIDIIYTDEDKISMDGSVYFQPHIKPEFNLELLRSVNYFCHLVVIRRTLIDQAGMLDPAFDGAQDYDFVLRCAEQARHICHIPRVLYHWRAHQDSTAENPESKRYAFEAGKRALEEHLKRQKLKGRVEQGSVAGIYHVTYELPETKPSITMILYGSRMECEKRAEQVKKIGYPDLEILCAAEEEIEETGNTLADFLNSCAKKANGELLWFLDTRIEILEAETIQKLAAGCLQPNVGMIGPRVDYPDGSIRQCGCILAKTAEIYCLMEGQDARTPGYFARNFCGMDVSVLLAECMMVRRELFEKLQGFHPAWSIRYAAADLCLRAQSQGQRVLYYPAAAVCLHMVFAESTETDETKKAFQKRWNSRLQEGDPYYPPQCFAEAADYSLRLQ